MSDTVDLLVLIGARQLHSSRWGLLRGRHLVRNAVVLFNLQYRRPSRPCPGTQRTGAWTGHHRIGNLQGCILVAVKLSMMYAAHCTIVLLRYRGFAMLKGRCVGADVRCDSAVLSGFSATSDDVDGPAFSEANLEDCRSGAKAETALDMDGARRVECDDAGRTCSLWSSA
ncbi:hypothetical protein CONLIGDRAFT_143058 [Coniochaeta ligniaria NRRL 30616]|uniref:Uncharacterized protein n=1 Tax=Coniochaeta ligniaria NRRL 30616 TaxID=1408157 RepID=A0A1J7J6J8_9PEZI|nr:hypothetical protein CONLIGDRAFT_143058 [Coniochaeta ligniaria NRRL 30616]